MTTFNVQGMTCNMCVKHVTKAVQAVEPNADVKVDLATGQGRRHARAQGRAGARQGDQRSGLSGAGRRVSFATNRSASV